MQKSFFLVFLFLIANLITHAQADCNTHIEYITVESEILNTKRQLKLQKPRNYDPESGKTYPLIFVFDADYLFEPVAGNVDYLSYWEEIPKAFVVGVNQARTRLDDGKYGKFDYLPKDTGARFFDFIQVEVLPFLKNEYNIGEYAVIVGHDYMANFMNLFLFSDRTDFQGFINLSPDIPEGLIPYIKDRFETSKEKFWYSLSTGTKDLDFIQRKTKKLYDELYDVENLNLQLSYNSFENKNHYTLVSYALPFCLSNVFAPYTPIDKKELNDYVLKAKDPVDYLKEKYDLIKKLYDVDQKVRVEDLIQIYNVIEQQDNWDACKRLAHIAQEEYPASLLYYYFIAKHHQGIGEPRKAYNAYRAGYIYKDAGGITNEMLIQEADILKEAFGY